MTKYRSIKTTIDGHTFDSRHEAKTYLLLRSMMKAVSDTERVVSIELQPVFELQEGYVRDGKKIRPIIYRGDFRVTYADGRVEIIDAKGCITKEYALKKKILLYKYPDLIFKEV